MPEGMPGRQQRKYHMRRFVALRYEEDGDEGATKMSRPDVGFKDGHHYADCGVGVYNIYVAIKWNFGRTTIKNH
jgi:hypothetical protein